ncbi:neuropeptide Y receptor type 2-like [Condylostylus longicornis]|uniref:neuropeptide Y receptor type 2-like n=1 Tax=Condylostylus longicornis TaxID=2530218 RepID=UPI00244E257A|nr:neuropeptide Y receptor type 2-like [Condylostylus longicornis]
MDEDSLDSSNLTLFLNYTNWDNEHTIENKTLVKNNGPTNITDLMDNTAIQIIFGSLYTSIFILGIFGNFLVCYVVFSNKSMLTVTNLFISNLALSDIMLCILAIPFTPLYTFLKEWIFGKVLCHVVPYSQGCSVYISTFTLTAIAIDRFFVIIYPFHPRMKISSCVSIIIIIWILALVLTLPFGLFRHVYTDTDDITGLNTTYCEEAWPTEHIRKVFGSITSALQFVLPFLIISFCYIAVSLQLAGRARAKPGTKTSRREEVDRDRKRRTNRMLIAMVAIFGFSWLPINVVNILNDFYAKTDDWKYYNLIFFIAHSIAMSSTCYNPFLYAWLNENFRKEFKVVLPCFNPSRGLSTNIESRQRWKRELTINCQSEPHQESLLTSRVSVSQLSMKDISQGCTTTKNSTIQQTVFVSSDTGQSNVKKGQFTETKILPSGVIETNFENKNSL